MMAAATNDPLGHVLIEQRLAQIPSLLLNMLKQDSAPLSPAILAAHSFTVTGIGSSEAHARYLTLLLNLHTNRQAIFVGFTAFTTTPMTNTSHSDQIMILFSQGLSPNAQMVLKYGDKYFSHVLLFTSLNNEQLARKCPWIQSSKVETIQFPLYDEYTTLIRVIGPACGFLAGILFIQKLSNKNFIQSDRLQEASLITSQTFSRSLLRQAMLDDRDQQFSHGPFYLILSSPLIDVSQNIAYKFVEGLYWSAPTVCDYLQFAHGPYQQLRSLANRQSAIVCIVDQSNQLDAALERRLRQMVERQDEEHRRINVYTLPLYSSSSIIYSIFETEMQFNQLVYDVMCARRCDQINWPGKGEDQPLYEFSG